MKTKMILLITLMLLITYATRAQGWLFPHALVLTSNGVLCKDTITPVDAKDITAINLIGISKEEHKFWKMPITEFQLTIYQNEKDILNLKGSSERLTDEMKSALANLKSGTKFYFEYIRGKNPDFDPRYIPKSTEVPQSPEVLITSINFIVK